MKPETTISHQERVLRLLVTIESNLSADLSLETLARQAGLSPYHFHRVFRALVGEPLKEYVRRLRLERAAHELAHSARRPVIEIALDAGYETHESFTRAFRAALGRPPSEYRGARKPRATPAFAVHAAPPYQTRTRRLLSATDEPRVARVERLRSLRVAFIRHVGPYEAVTPVFTRLAEFVRARHDEPTDVLWIGVPHDNPQVTPPDRQRFDCCVMVTGRVAPAGDIGVRDIGGDVYAATTHYGAFDRLVETYGWLGGHFMPSAGLMPRRAPAIEIYLTHPETTPPQQLLTDILLPIEA